MLYVKLFGGFQLFINGKAVVMTRPRQRAIITYLVLRYPQPITRAQLAMDLWTESGDSQAMTNLRGHLLELRTEFPALEQILDFARGDISWRSEAAIGCDVAEFKQLFRQALRSSDEESVHVALEKAAALYEGDLFPGCFEEWIVEEREQLRDHFTNLLERLGLLHEARRNPKEAILYVRRLLRFDPQREESYRQLMRLHALVGDLAEVERAYQQCKGVLQRDFKAAPSQPTSALYERLMHSAQPQVAPMTTLIKLIGRQLEWLQLQKCWSNVVSRGTHCGLLEGELGIGKTRIIEELIDTVQRQGFTVLQVNCSLIEQQSSYAPLRTWLHSDGLRSQLRMLDPTQRSDLAQLFPDLATEQSASQAQEFASSGIQQARLNETLARLFLARRAPLLLVLDNLQWCDSDTLTWLHSLLLQDRLAPVLVLGAICSAYPAQALLPAWRATLRQAGLLSEIALPPLTLPETQLLAEAATGQAISGDEATYYQRLSQGNPLQILDQLRSQGKLAQAYSKSVEQHLLFAFDLLIPHLPAQAYELLECVALLESPTTLARLLQSNHLSEENLLITVDLLLHANILCQYSGEQFAFTNRLFPQLILRKMNSIKRRFWQGRLNEPGENR